MGDVYDVGPDHNIRSKSRPDRAPAPKARRPRERKTPVERPALTLLVIDEQGEFKVTLPLGARLTFGPDIPFQPKTGMVYHEGNGKRCYSLRIYAGAGNDTLIAVFSNVKSFRDITIPLHRAIVKEAGKVLWKSDETGYEVTQNVKREQTFVDSSRLLTDGD